MAKIGRPTVFTEKLQKQIKSLVLLGLTDEQVCQGVGISTISLKNYREKYPAFFNALKDWKAEADKKVVKSLYQRACGYETIETKVKWDPSSKKWQQIEIPKRYPPDATSMIFWLKNRHPEEWRDAQVRELTGKNGKDLIPSSSIPEEERKALIELARKYSAEKRDK